MLTEERLTQIADRLACPACKGKLERQDAAFVCQPCGRDYPIRNGRLYFCEPQSAEDELDSVKDGFKKRFGRLYYTLLKPLLAPGFPFDFNKYVLANVNPEKELVVDLGSGNRKGSPHFISLDFMDFEEIDIVADMSALPFRPGGVDVFTSEGVLEHVADIGAVAQEIARATKVGGRGIHLIPFMYPYHASPYDFQRYTSEGVKRLFGPWQLEEQFASAGPFTLFNVMLLELLSILLSFGNRKLKGLIYLGLCPLVVPLKFLDIFFVRRPAILALAPNIVTHLRKPSGLEDAHAG